MDQQREYREINYVLLYHVSLSIMPQEHVTNPLDTKITKLQ